MHKNATKCNKTLNKWCKNKHGASKIMDTLETYHLVLALLLCSQSFAVFIDLSMISFQKTHCGTGKHWDLMFARLSASSLLALLT
jgi:hypothetical protein